MTTNKDVFAKRRVGELEEAYVMATELMNHPQKSDWDIKAFAWCLIDLIKRDANNPAQVQNLQHHIQQLTQLEIDSSDEVLSKQRVYTLNLCNPNRQTILEAKKLSKAGRHQESLNLYRQIFNEGDHTEEVQTSFAWELYRLAKQFVEQENPNFMAAKKHLNDYFILQTEKPSLLHTCFLQLADKIAKEGQLNMGAFARMWNLEHLRPEDYQPYKSNDGKVYPSLAEKVVQHASKDAYTRQSQQDLHYILPFISKCIVKYPDNVWLTLNKAKTLMALGQHDEAVSFSLKVVKSKRNDYWAWELLGDIHAPTSSTIALSCYCKALLCSTDINFVSKVKIKLAELLVNNEAYAQAKFEIEAVANYRAENQQKVSATAEALINQPWYKNTAAAISNHDFYLKNTPVAEELLYKDLPWINAVLGATFTLDSKPNKPKRKLYIQATPTPLEISIPETKLLLHGAQSGMAIRVKGELDHEKRFQVYALETRDSDKPWDIFTEFVGVVDHVNHQKALLHFMVNRHIDGIVKLSNVNAQFSEGDAISVRVAQYTSSQGSNYSVLTANKTELPVPESLVKSFNSSVRTDNGMGFTDNDIFIPPSLVQAHNIQDDDYVCGTAILNYNKKRSTWGWKAIRINDVR